MVQVDLSSLVDLLGFEVLLISLLKSLVDRLHAGCGLGGGSG